MCWDCERLGKECIYIYNPKNVKRKTSPRKKVEKKPKVKKNEVKKEVQDLVDFESYQTQPAANDGITDIKMETINDNQDFSLNVLNVNDDDVNLIFQNLNDMVSMKLKDSQLNFDDYNSISLDDMFLKPESVSQNKNNETSKFNTDIGHLLLPTNNENMNFMGTAGNFNSLLPGTSSLKVASPGYANYTDVISGTLQSLNSPISQQMWNSNNFNQLQSAIRETPINSNNLQAMQQQPSSVKSFW